MKRALLGALLLTVAGCGIPTSGTMKGIVVEVTGDLTSVEGFTALVEGDALDFIPSPDGDYAFPLPHLRDHLRSGDPVLIGWELVDGVRMATFLDDA
ncbi:hypothetical protein BH23ACT5_BH23ACT5_20430 [soil metagenome]